MKKISKELKEYAIVIINYATMEKRKKNHTCKKEFSKDYKKCFKVQDHCHYAGKYRSAANNIYKLTV